ncbi:hypothetical protein [Alkaliphilus oremlandii]|uniref:Uncharacterized protein n=1 Tax=Alkaliphilus oremlandii (strain OhILAs) TaxID=350688 RepID=A8MFP1_ALKOO|nr:hypothetical protein [Alkaliphilus oremlandii]ABW17680.1 conserved hypothetical protein [Alkaliphilus oremlandii OhILAs]
MDKNLIRFLMFLAYCVPYGYLAMKGDATFGTMIFYGLMIASFGILCRTAIRTNNAIVLIIGNVLSFISSYLFTFKNLSEEWGWYFKPFTPMSLLLLITTVFFTIQVLIIFRFSKK